MIKRIFDREFMEENDYPYEFLEAEFVESHRWYDIYEGVFEYEGKFYMTTYNVPSTEMQEEDPWGYDSEIECIEVVKLPVVVQKWVPKAEA